MQASLARVWKALTSAEDIKQYMYGTTVHTTWQEGSSIRFTGSWEGTPYEDKGTILTCKENDVLEYSYWSSFTGVEDVPQNYAVIRFELKAEGNITRLLLTQRNSPTPTMHENSEKGWSDVLAHITKLVENNETS